MFSSHTFQFLLLASTHLYSPSLSSSLLSFSTSTSSLSSNLQDQSLSSHGRKMASLPLDPIFAHLLLKSQELGYAFQIHIYFLFRLIYFYFTVSIILTFFIVLFVVERHVCTCVYVYVQNDGPCIFPIIQKPNNKVL